MADRLTREQAAAVRPSRSAWISANAGSGKTRVLTARVARCLLEGVRPDRILCLTYTRAAAGEGVRITNASQHEKLVMLKHFGPDNPDARPLVR